MDLYSFPPGNNFESVEVLKKLAQAHRYLAELKGLARSIPNEGILIDTLTLQEAKDSSEVRGQSGTPDEDNILANLKREDGKFISVLGVDKNSAQAALVEHFNPATVEPLMCRHLLSVDWRGYVYDCDFNQMLDLPLADGAPRQLWDITRADIERAPIALGKHCYGCTAGAGSSCGGALT